MCFNCAGGDRPIYDPNPETNPDGSNGWTTSRCIEHARDPSSRAKYIVGDEPSLRWLTLSDACDFEVVEKLFYLQGYAFAINKKSAFLADTISTTTLEVREEQYIDQLRGQYYAAGDCQDADASAGLGGLRDQLSVATFAPVGWLFLVFLCASIVVHAVEASHKRAPEGASKYEVDAASIVPTAEEGDDDEEDEDGGGGEELR